MNDNASIINNGNQSGEGDLAARLLASQTQAQENYDKFLLAMADFENYKRRVERQIAETSLITKKEVITKILPVLDNLERAVAFTNTSGLRDGLQATLRMFENILANQEIYPVSLKGQLFDPKFAEAIATQPAPIGVQDNTILDEAHRAYFIGKEILRPAQVVVATTTF